MITLGIHGGINRTSNFELGTPVNWLHDAAAALCRDGEVVAAAEEERFTRIKHVSHFPIEAIRYCLESQGITLADVDRVVLSSRAMNQFLKLVNNWRHGSRAWLAENSFEEFAASVLGEEFGSDIRQKLSFAGHHLSHTLSAVWQAGFPECLCVVLDGWGDGATGLIGSFRHGTLHELRMLQEPGPAAMYLMGTEILGFAQGDEYKVMGLAPYGASALVETAADRLIELREDGQFSVSFPELRQLAASADALRQRGAAIDSRHTHFAAVLQLAAEKVALHVIEHFQRVTEHRFLCLAGGFAQNCSVNGRVLRSGIFRDVFVQPAAYDAGCAVGAALHGHLDAGGSLQTKRLRHVSLGVDIPDRTDLGELLRSWSAVVDIEQPSDICDTAGRLIAEGRIVAWVQGRAEFGARALGNRSILADPRPAENKDRINAMVKKREAFRPFAPSVLEERLSEYFDVPAGNSSLPFMVFVVPVREEYRSLLGAVTHVDGSARVQSVSRESNERYWRLIEAFWRRTGLPVVLNTSFNNDAEPIVNTATDALNSYLSTEIDDLIIGDFLIRKRTDLISRDIVRTLVPTLSHRFALMQRADRRGRLEQYVQDRCTNAPLTISRRAYRLLSQAADRRVAFARVIRGTAAEASDAVLDELFDLWCRRVFVSAGPEASPARRHRAHRSAVSLMGR